MDGVSLSVKEVLEATGGALLAGSPAAAFATFSTDTRSLTPGALFFALKGERFDGHAFLAEAVARGAAGAVVAAPPGEGPRPPVLLRVRDPRHALGQVAGCWRRRHKVQVVAVTGTNGKTTTKEMVAAVLARRYRVLASPGNLNNLVGVPLALFRLAPEHEVAVVELGMSAPGEIGRLAEICEPDVGIITNVGEGHLEFLGSVEAVAAAKGEMLPFLGGDKTAILCADDPQSRPLLPRVKGRLLTFGLSGRADVRAGAIRVSKVRRTSFTLSASGGTARVRLPIPGRHNILNALAAAAAGVALGVPVKAIAAGLAAAPVQPMRMQRVSLASGAVAYNDAYNANPNSMAAALEAFAAVRGPGRTILVLGDMLELGAHAPEAHRRVGRLAASLGPDRLIAVGGSAAALAEGARAGGLPADRIVLCREVAEARVALAEETAPGVWVFVKASRGVGLERVLEGL
ncbi:MAG TPA: UDP-N-acetylmuramoyl-tripeptide--D-alanyl-D-alanine ligase [Candidatus Methylomirabilis sp.]|jgi:UDP-N-acetylmuramoyl-tripeptide--D-alanyl-D-alanine ligase|nr:UDP-N-acetylmuramoyl-tripeptide--D-alanyl-D-alanine ligase [Candidatus Methylomirabilis sp.]